MVDPDNSTVRTDAALVGGDRQWLRTGYDLHVIEPHGERRVPLCYSLMTIGSGSEDKKNDLQLAPAAGVSPRQAMLKLIGGQVYFNNVDPRNKTLVNGEETSFRQLVDGDEITIGETRIRLLKLNEAVGFLEGYTDPHRREHWTVSPGVTTLGRAGSKRGNQVGLSDATVSREHATIEYVNGVFVLKPTSEATWINAEQVTGLRVLNDEDLLQFGQQLLRFRTYRVGSEQPTAPRALSSKDATILFSDVWDYTRLAEDRPLEETISQLNEIYKGLGRIIMDHNGTLMTYLGDAMMAMFSAEDPDHPRNAVRASLAMISRLSELNDRWAQENKPVLRIGIGIATGEVMVGDVGMTGHREFAAMGDTTNIAARIEKLTRDFDANILVSGTTAESLGNEFTTRGLGYTEIRGRRNPVEVYEILGKAV